MGPDFFKGALVPLQPRHEHNRHSADLLEQSDVWFSA